MTSERKHHIIKLLQSRPIVFVLITVAIHVLIAAVVWWRISISTITVADSSLKWQLVGIITVLLLFNLLAFCLMMIWQRGQDQEVLNEQDKLESEVMMCRKTIQESQEALREANNQNRLLQKELEIRQSTASVLEQKVNDDAVQIAEASAQISANRELLQKARARAEVSDRYKSAFVACVSHEIHTPIHIIMGCADMLCRPTLSPERRAEHTENLVTHSKRFLEVFDNIMLYSKIQSGDITITPQPFDLNFLLNGINMHADFLIKQSGKPLTLKFGCNFKEKKYITSYEEGLKIVLLKLINNAVKFSESGQIAIDYRITDSRVLFSVTDNGIGIPPNRYNEIFESFYQVDNSLSRHYQGLGIGLSICKGLLNMMGGRISVDSQVGAGSTFTFDIPAQMPQLSTDLYSQISKAVDTNPFDGNILLISDNNDDIQLITQFLNTCGCETLVARTYRQAYEMYNDNRDVAFVLLDLDLPGSNTLAVELPQIDISVTIIIIAQPHTEASILASAPIVGRTIITRPITTDSVVDAINNLLILSNKTLTFQKT
ncbi:MAG: ATP-binding protein [Bacteroidales bacterium]|nr:ATP-binding protein [Bacteroidales bacterium]